MNKTLLTLASLSASIVSLSACTQSPTSLPPGEYHSTNETTNSQGTDYRTDTTTNVTQDRYGNKTATTTTKKTTDPKGLMNKTTSTTTHTDTDGY